jgi:serine/threonine protein kinase
LPLLLLTQVTDFGLAKGDMGGEGARTNSFIGTMEYMAPEIVSGGRQLAAGSWQHKGHGLGSSPAAAGRHRWPCSAAPDTCCPPLAWSAPHTHPPHTRHPASGKGHNKSVDWWSIGILLYEMLCGMPPFRAKSRQALQAQITGGKVKYPKFLSSDAQNLLKVRWGGGGGMGVMGKRGRGWGGGWGGGGALAPGQTASRFGPEPPSGSACGLGKERSCAGLAPHV